jgi:hypothetical protein
MKLQLTVRDFIVRYYIWNFRNIQVDLFFHVLSNITGTSMIMI